MRKLENDCLTPTEQGVYDAIIENCDKIEKMSIDQLASKAHVSSATIVKYAKKVGFNGYKDLKYYIVNNRPRPLAIDNPYYQMQKQIVSRYFTFVDEHVECIEYCCEQLKRYNRLVIYTDEESKILANYFLKITEPKCERVILRDMRELCAEQDTLTIVICSTALTKDERLKLSKFVEEWLVLSTEVDCLRSDINYMRLGTEEEQEEDVATCLYLLLQLLAKQVNG